PHRPGEGAILPEGALGTDQMAPHQIAGGEVIVARHGMQWPPQALRHVLDKAGLAATRGPLDQHRQAVAGGAGEDLHLAALGDIAVLPVHGASAKGCKSLICHLSSPTFHQPPQDYALWPLNCRYSLGSNPGRRAISLTRA